MGRLPELTGMRGLAALYVAGFHAWQQFDWNAPTDPPQWVAWIYSFGWLGVDLFFVLSAFLLSRPLIAGAAAGQGPRFWLGYLQRRWIRIAPPYYASLLFALVAAGSVNYIWTRPDSLGLHLSYTANFAHGILWDINPVYWSLAVEFQFYVLLPILLWFMLRTHPAVGLVTAYAASMAWNYLTLDFHGGDNFWAISQVPGYFFHFALGIAAARLHVRGVTIPTAWRTKGWALAALILVGSVYLATPPPGTWQPIPVLAGTAIIRAGPALAFAVFILLAAQPGPLASRLLGNRASQLLGETSYSLYLVHYPVMVFMVERLPWTLEYGFAAFQLILAAPLMMATWLLYQGVEVPSLRMKDRTKRTSARVPTPLASGARPEPSLT